MAGPSIGVAIGMPVIWTIVISVLGMMTSVMIFSVIGAQRLMRCSQAMWMGKVANAESGGAHTDWMTCALVLKTSQGTLIASAGADRTIKIWDT